MVMKKRQLAPGIVVYSDVLENYDTLVQDIEEGLSTSGQQWMQSSIQKDDKIQVDTNYRDTMLISVNYKDFIDEDFINLQDAFNSSLSNMFLTGFGPLESDYKQDHQLDTISHEEYSILKYGEGQKFTNHIDDHKDHHRRMSWVYYINDDYTGGEISFPRFNLTYKPVANEFIVFPSNYIYNHSVLPVIEGTRYAVVSWLK
jgi:Rps23 Pro-64 3,4-dihydroxylase Tpa1-like proline 4-hydroxylase